MEMTKEQMEAELERLAPFHHDVELPHGLSTAPAKLSRRPGQRTRMSDMLVHAWPDLLEACGGSLAGKRVLDVGCNCGGFAFQAAADGAEYVLGVDVVDRYIEQANFIKSATDASGVEFRELAIEELDPDEIGTFDVTLNLGLLYHLENPVLGMKILSDLTTELMVVDSNVDPNTDGPYWKMNFPKETTADAKSASTSLWRVGTSTCQFLPTPQAVEELMGFLGFPNISRLEPKQGLADRYLKGKRVTFIATRDGAAAA